MAEDDESAQQMTRDEIELALVALDSHEACAILAARSALRVLPHCVQVEGEGWLFNGDEAAYAKAVLAACFRAFQAKGSLAVANAVAQTIAVATAAAATSAAYAAEAAKNANYATYAGPTEVVKATSSAVVAAAHASVNEPNLALFWQTLRSDLDAAKVSGEALRKRPLWSRPVDNKRWKRMCGAFGSIDDRLPKLLEGVWRGEPDLDGIAAWLEEWHQKQIQANDDQSASEKTLPPISGAGSGPSDQDSRLLPHVRGHSVEAPAERDCLNSERFVEALQSVLCERSDSRHFAIGLFGDWGRGKSSFVGFLKKKLLPESPASKPKQPEFLVAEFNAWKNEKANSHGAMLAQSVLERLIEGLSFSERLRLALNLRALRSSGWRRAVRLDIKTWYAWLLMLAPMLTALIIVGLPLWFLCWGTDLGFWKTIVAGAVAFVGMALHAVPAFLRDNLTEWFKKADVSRLSSWLKLPDYEEHRGLLGEIHKTLSFLCELQLERKNRHLLLVIDDLDRCHVDTVKEVLDAVRLVADIPRVVTLVAIDPRMAYAAVEKHYEQFGHGRSEPAQVARDYLSKVFEVSLSLPRVKKDEIRSLVEEKLIPDSDVKKPKTSKPETAKTMVLDETNFDEGTLSSSTIPPEGSKQDYPADNLGPERQADETDHKVLPEEREHFRELVGKFDFGNPRLMGRLYFAWRMLKFLVFHKWYYSKGECLPLMELLFWSEWLLQQEAGARAEYENWFTSGEGKAPLPAGVEEIAGDLRKLRDGKLAGLDFIEAKARVDLVLLPASKSLASAA